LTIAATDAHARLGWQDPESEMSDAGRLSLAVPSYETMFRVMSTTVQLDRPLGRAAEADAARVVDALVRGRAFTAVDGFARGGVLEFHGETREGNVPMGETVEGARLTRLVVHVRAPVETSLRLLRNGVVLKETSGTRLSVEASELPPLADGEVAAAYRVEAFLRRGAAPWMVSNPIWVRTPESAGRSSSAAASEIDGSDYVELVPGSEWRIERDPGSRGSLRRAPAGESLRLEFVLARAENPWVAAVRTLLPAEREVLVARGGIHVHIGAHAPMRVSVQLRAAAENGDLRWRASAYVGPDAHAMTIPVAQFEPVGADAAAVSPTTATSLLVVIDRGNTLPGTEGWLDLRRIALRRAGTPPLALGR
jgi:hypothetical protein